MNHHHMHHVSGKPRAGIFLALGIMLSLGIGVPDVESAPREEDRRKPKPPVSAVWDIDNEGPVTRVSVPGWYVTWLLHRNAIRDWKGPIRIDLILPIRILPDGPPDRL